MGLFSNLFSNQFKEIIRWDNPSPDLLIKEWDNKLDEIKNRSSLVVDPGMASVFVHNGKIEAIQTHPGTWSLETTNIPFVSSLKNFLSGGETHDKGHMYFVKIHDIINQKWGTPNAVVYVDPVYGFPVELRAFGNFTFRVDNIENFWTSYFANRSSVSTNEVRGIMMDRIIGMISSLFAKKALSYTEIDQHLPLIAEELRDATKSDFDALGLILVDFRIEDINFTEKTQEFIGKITAKAADVAAISMTKNLDAVSLKNYTQLEQLEIAKEAAKHDGVMGDMLGAGIGMALGSQLAQSSVSATSSPSGEISSAKRLQDLKMLFDQQLISQEEFDAKRQEVLKDI